jgi:hypothetical protein
LLVTSMATPFGSQAPSRFDLSVLKNTYNKRKLWIGLMRG